MSQLKGEVKAAATQKFVLYENAKINPNANQAPSYSHKGSSYKFEYLSSFGGKKPNSKLTIVKSGKKTEKDITSNLRQDFGVNIGSKFSATGGTSGKGVTHSFEGVVDKKTNSVIVQTMSINSADDYK